MGWRLSFLTSILLKNLFTISFHSPSTHQQELERLQHCKFQDILMLCHHDGGGGGGGGGGGEREQQKEYSKHVSSHTRTRT